MGLPRRHSLTAAVVAFGCLLSGCARTAAVARDRSAVYTPIAQENAEAVARFITKGRSALLSAVTDASFSEFLRSPDDRTTKVAGDAATRVAASLRYMDSFLANSGEVCFIDRSGPENVRLLSGVRQPIAKLSPDESETTFFAPTFAIRTGEVYVARPYFSPDTETDVVSLSTPIGDNATSPDAMVHVEIGLAPLKNLLQAPDADIEVQLVEASTGESILSTKRNLPAVMTGSGPYVALANRTGSGKLTIAGRTVSYAEVDPATSGANHWFVVVRTAG
jgi:hypothetical protein